MMSGTEMSGSGPVLVQVVDVKGGRQIGWRDNLAEQLGDRSEDIRRAIAVGSRAVADSLPGLPGAQGWRMGEVSASFGVTLTAEAGAILSKASAGATFEVTVTYQREQ
jgi:hypothetical protein